MHAYCHKVQHCHVEHIRTYTTATFAHNHVCMCLHKKEAVQCLTCAHHQHVYIHIHFVYDNTRPAGCCLNKETGKWWVGEVHTASQSTSTWNNHLNTRHSVYVYVYNICLCVHTWIESHGWFGKICMSACTHVDWEQLGCTLYLVRVVKEESTWWG